MSHRRAESPSLLSHMDDLIDRLRELIPPALTEFDAKSIHQARVSTRRLKASLELLAIVLSAEHRKPLAKVGQKLRRRLGRLRDLDVMIEHLNELTRYKQHAAACQWLIEKLELERTEARKRSSEKGSPAKVLAKLGAWWGVREEVKEARDAVPSLLAESLHDQLREFVALAHQLVTAPAESVEGSSSQEPFDPHALRIAGKALRYTLELATAAGHALPSDINRSFKRMQDALGLWHDCVVLTEQAIRSSLDAFLAHHDAAMQDRLFQLSRFLLNRARKQLNRCGTIWRERGEGLATTIFERFPLTQCATPPAAEVGAHSEA